jgi:hypothetical protein
VDPRDWPRPGVPSIATNIMRNTHTGSIILEHDGGGNRAQTVAALKIVIPRLLAAGYHFRTRSQPPVTDGCHSVMARAILAKSRNRPARPARRLVIEATFTV